MAAGLCVPNRNELVGIPNGRFAGHYYCDTNGKLPRYSYGDGKPGKKPAYRIIWGFEKVTNYMDETYYTIQHLNKTIMKSFLFLMLLGFTISAQAQIKKGQQPYMTKALSGEAIK